MKDDPRHRAADRLARRLATPEGLGEARRRQAAGELPVLDPPNPPGHPTAPELKPPGPSGDPGPAAAPPLPISIWRPRTRGGEVRWVRPEPSPLGDHYAARREIRGRPPEGVGRVCLFGESAAAGYLYAPHLTPAGVLEAQLREAAARSGAPGWEVLDLARTNEGCATLAATVEAAAQLRPDHLVLFAGNNWTLLETPDLSPWVPSVRSRQELAACLGADGGGPQGAVEAARLARRRGAEAAAAMLERVAAVARALGATVTLVLPEVNLDDWETRQPPLRLAGDGTGRWFRLLERARAALAAGDGAAAEAAAWEMVELDGATGPVPFRLLARALQRRAAAAPDGGLAALRAAALDAARSEIDATHLPLLAYLADPRAGRVAHQVQAAAARRHGFATVDLRRVFAHRDGGALPGRRWFLDYCHLTAEGTAVAMAAVATELLCQAGSPAGGGDRAALEADLAALPAVRPSAAARATAHLGAAIHTAHRHLPVTGGRGLLEHHLGLALEADPEVTVAALLDLADVRTAAVPELLTAAHDRNLARPAPLLLQHGWRWPHLDGGLLRATAAALAASPAEGAPQALAEMARLLTRRAVPLDGAHAAGADLVHPPHALAEPAARFHPEATAGEGLAPRAHLRIPWPEVGFDVVVATEARRLEIDAVLRLPEAWGEADVSVELDGLPIGTLTAGPAWRRDRLAVAVPPPADGAALPSLRRLTLRWPLPPPRPGDDRAAEPPLAAALRDLELGRPADLHPVLGEVASLRMSVAD